VAQTPVEIKPTIQSPLRLRSISDENLTVDEVQRLIKQYNFYCYEYEYTKDWSNSSGKGIVNDFILQKNGKVILDRMTGLMWQQAGSLSYITFAQAEKYIMDLNRQNFIGFSDWRLPTLDEAMSLMTPKKADTLYLDKNFDRKQYWIWTSDKFSANTVWVIDFRNGYCHKDIIGGKLYVRAVRSAK
jgi:hypothetical protein